MARERKTRKEKMIAQLRRELVAKSSLGQERVEQVNIKPVSVPKFTTAVISPHSYSYVVSDLKKTTIVTTLILAIQFVLYFLIFR